MSNIEKIGKFEAMALFITIISTNLITNIPDILLSFSGPNSWLNLIYLTGIGVAFILIVCKLLKPFINFDILDISEFLGGKTFKYIMAILYITLFFFFSAFCARYFANFLKIVYFNNIPLSVLILLLLVPSVFASKLGLRAISGTNVVFFPLLVVSLIAFSWLASRYFSLQNLFPVFGYGIKETFFYQIPNIFAFNVLAYLYFLTPFLKSEKSFKTISVLAVILCGIYLIISVVTLIATFPFIFESNETMSLYLIARLINFGHFFQRVDAIFIFIWILIVLLFLSLNIFVISNIIKKTVKLKTHSGLVYSIGTITFAIAIAFKDIPTIKFLLKNYYRLYSFILVFVISFFVLFFAFLKSKKQKGVVNENK